MTLDQLQNEDLVQSPKQALMRPHEEMNSGILVHKDADDPINQRSNAYEVALVEDRRIPYEEEGDSYFFIEGAVNLENLTIDEPEPLVIRIDLGGENFASVTAFKNSNPMQLAERLCAEHNLTEAIIDPLCNRIRMNMDSHFSHCSSHHDDSGLDTTAAASRF